MIQFFGATPCKSHVSQSQKRSQKKKKKKKNGLLSSGESLGRVEILISTRAILLAPKALIAKKKQKKKERLVGARQNSRGLFKKFERIRARCQ